MSTLENPEHVSLTVGGVPYEVFTLSGEERLSKHFRFELRCGVDGAPPPLAELVGEDAIIVLRDGHGGERTITGLVAEARFRGHDDHRSSVQFVIRPLAWPRSLGRDQRAFLDMTVPDIAREVFGAARGAKRFELTSSYRKRVYTVQYREDDVTFVGRLLEDEGIYYWFDHADGSALVFADDSTSAPDAPGAPLLPFEPEGGMNTGQSVVDRFASRSRAATTRFTIGSFDFNNPALKVQGSAGDGPFEYYDSPGGGPEAIDAVQARAKVYLESARAQRTGATGRTTSVCLYPGVRFGLTNHPLARLDGPYLVTGVRYRIEQRHRNGSSERAYDCTFDVIPAGTPYRTPDEIPRARQPGASSGIVVGPPGDEIHTDKMARVRVQQHWDRLGKRDHTAGRWMRVAQRGSAESMLFPRIGWAVLTFNEEGGVDAPSVFNRIPDGEHLPPYALPENKTRTTFKTATTPGGGSFNEIRFEDKKGAEEMFLLASRDMNVLVQSQKNERVMRDQALTVGVNHKRTVGDQLVTLTGRDQKVTIGSNETLTIRSSKSTKTGGNETTTIGGSRKLTIGNDAHLGVQGNRRLSVGAAMIDVCLGTIAAEGGIYAELVGGAKIRMTKGSIADGVGKPSAQVIGGLKLQKAKQNCAVDVKKQLHETIGAAMMLTTEGAYRDTAEKKSEWKITAALGAKAPSMLVEAKNKIVFVCGASSITIQPEAVEISSPTFDLSGAATADYDTDLVSHN